MRDFYGAKKLINGSLLYELYCVPICLSFSCRNIYLFLLIGKEWVALNNATSKHYRSNDNIMN